MNKTRVITTVAVLVVAAAAERIVFTMVLREPPEPVPGGPAQPRTTGPVPTVPPKSAKLPLKFDTCENHIGQLALASKIFSVPKGDGIHYPRTMAELYTSGMIPDPTVFLCPDDKSPVELAEGLKTSYESALDLAPAPFDDGVPDDLPIFWDKPGNHEGGRNVCTFSVRASFLTEDEFQNELARLKAYFEVMQAEDDE